MSSKVLRYTILMLLTLGTALLFSSEVALARVIDCPTSAGIGNDCFGSNEDDTMTGSPVREEMYGVEGHDVLRGFGGDDVLDGGLGNDTLFGDEGHDYLVGGEGSDTFFGGAGSDAYYFWPGWGTDTIRFDPSGSDILLFRGVGLVAPITIDLSEGRAFSGTNVVRFPPTTEVDPASGNAAGGIERASGAFGDDLILGSEANNQLEGRDGADALHAFGGRDFLEGGRGSDLLDGGEGNDYYQFRDGWGADRIAADPSGVDWLVFSTSSLLRVDLGAGRASSDGGSLTVPRTVMIENVSGGSSNNVILGNSANNRLFGWNSSDYLDGGAGFDTILAYAGDDTIWVIDGQADRVSCGDGYDVVYYDSPPGDPSPDYFHPGSISSDCESLIPEEDIGV